MTLCECHSACYRPRRLPAARRISRTTRVAAPTHGMSLSGAAVLAALLATWGCVAAEQRRDAPPLEAGVYLPELEEQVDLADVLNQGDQELDESRSEAARKLASLLSVLRSTLNERQQGQAAAEDEDDPQQLAVPFPALLPLLKDEDKRGSYMSLCHFKICNMGRKRNLRWSPFIRM
uniref:CNMamide n=1 Tax=Carausius morosus TaxID=7022 RepID=A0A6G4ZU26_CARMO|nr:CNMamide [Carausius morosus]